MNEFLLVFTTVPDEKIAQKIVKGLIEERLAACVTISASAQSYYWWEGKISKDNEHVLFIKTKAILFSKLEKKIQEIHPYEVPEIIAVPILKGPTRYLNTIKIAQQIQNK